MNEQRAASTATVTTSPLRDSPGNVSSNHIRHWSQSSTTPLRLAKHDSLLTPNSISNTHSQKLPTQLARRQSSSYNHVKNNALVSKSPFKVNATAKASRIPTPSRSQTVPEDENQPDLGSYRRRQSKGLHVLVKEQVVTKSPFRSGKSQPELKTEPPERGRSLTPTQPPNPRSQVISAMSSSNRSINVKPEATCSSDTPITCSSRMMSSTEASSSPKSVLVSPKRFHGPRSLSASPGAELKAQRRKTVAFVELIDVLEFDKEDVSDIAYSADEYGSPEPQSPIVTCNEDSFDSSVEQVEILLPPEESPVVDDCPIQRTPHISRVDVRRRLMEQRPDEYLENENSFSQTLSDVFADVPLQNSQITNVSGSSSVLMEPPLMSPPDVAVTADTSVNLDNSTSDLQSALDSLILGVEKELMGTHTDNLNSELSADRVENLQDQSVIPHNNFNSISLSEHDEGSTVSVCVDDARPQCVEMSPESSTSTDNDNDEPGTPREQNSQLPSLSVESIRIENDDSPILALAEKVSHSFTDKSIELDSWESSMTDLSGCELHLTSTEIETSSPPRKESIPYNATPSSSLALPPLSFDDPLESTSSWNMDLNIGPSRSHQQILDDTSNNQSPPMHFVGPAPPVPPKDVSAIRRREELIKARRRELQQNNPRPFTYHEGRPRRRRSLSTGDAEDLVSADPASQRRVENLRDCQDISHLDIPLEQEESDRALGAIIDQELKLRRKPTIKEQQARHKYKIREREDIIYASGEDKVSHSRQAGDVDIGKAWKTIRRPSDMNEHSQLIKQYRALQKPGKAYGKVFVRVLGIRKLNIPMPSQPTPFTCTLNNGIHFVTTPECRLGRDARIEQEFELIEHSKLEFKLTLKVSRTPEIVGQDKINMAPPMPISATPPPPPPPMSSSRGVRSFFGVGSSPKKHHKITVVAASPTIVEPIVENNFARYIKPDGTLAQTLVSFKEIASRCDTRIFETSFPLIGQRTTGSGKTLNVSPQTIGEIVLKIFRLPPLPGIPNDQLPQSLDECHRGLQYTSWHKVTYHEGILTQNGGDCRTWRRRLLRVIGSNLVAFNDVTKKATATVDLKKAIAVEDDDMSLLSNIASASRRARDEFDEVYKVERSFRLIFPDDEEITFFADTEEAKQTWLKVLGALVGHIPPNPLWAELAWQRQEDLRQQESLTNNVTFLNDGSRLS
ncbi:hypothetical protein Clacol_002651 [Clathrus columnatus]|uniref:PH domain-containing protein n=1 Tax=Clathrus columnatus TaxID=1419009 RepID=A0AAV5A642_9AGAM|nr:hypothetical protein Clacol_002651 [Clathrus columnatus]